jgi:hypothetical protein
VSRLQNVINNSHEKKLTMQAPPSDDRVGSSPALSRSSADEALFELLGLTELSTLEDCCSPFAFASTQPGIPDVEALAPPKNCLRPDASLNDNTAILLLIKNALSPSQCSHIIERGYHATNDGGAHFGPRYVKEAASTTDASLKVKLGKPNHHKVCVFEDDTILTWLRRLVAEKAHAQITDWQCSSHATQKRNSNTCGNDVAPPQHYIINPRLRLLRYDGIDEDVFLPHYDATTTMTVTDANHGAQCYESQLTILCYLNADFVGGETLFLDSLHPTNTFLTVTPQTGHIVIFNHELYHASSRLVIDETIQVQRPLFQAKVVPGGTKFVLRSDVMFATSGTETVPPAVALPSARCVACLPLGYNGVTVATVADIVQQTNCSQTTMDALSDFMNVAIRTFLVPGREKLTVMLRDLGVDHEECQRFLQGCEAVVY